MSSGDLVVFESACGWNELVCSTAMAFSPPPYLSHVQKKGIKSLLIAWFWFISLLLYHLSRSGFPADHHTAILVTAEDTSQICTRWSHVTYAKMEPMKPFTLETLELWKVSGHVPGCNMPCYEPKSVYQVWVPDMWNTKVCTGLPESKPWDLSWQYVFSIQ